MHLLKAICVVFMLILLSTQKCKSSEWYKGKYTETVCFGFYDKWRSRGNEPGPAPVVLNKCNQDEWIRILGAVLIRPYDKGDICNKNCCQFDRNQVCLVEMEEYFQESFEGLKSSCDGFWNCSVSVDPVTLDQACSNPMSTCKSESTKVQNWCFPREIVVTYGCNTREGNTGRL